MFIVARLLLPAVWLVALAFSPQPAAPEPEAPIQKTAADRKLDQSDEPCGHYFWIARKNGEKFLYYFFGSAEWGKSKVGFYSENLYRVVVDPDKTPPTVQRITTGGRVSEVRVRMTSEELAASSGCLTGR